MLVFWLADDDDLVEDLEIDDGGSGSRGSGLLVGILIINTLLILAAIVWFVFFYDKGGVPAGGGGDNQVTSEASESDVKKDLGKGPIVEMREFVVNLKSASADKYLKVNVAVEVNTAGAEEELVEKKLVARDQILVFLSGLDVDQTTGIEGKQDIKEGIIGRLNNVLLKGKVNNVYFKDFVVQ